MSRRVLFAWLSLLLAGPVAPVAPAAAQSTEVGITSGLSVFTASGSDAVTIFSVPGNGFVLPTSNLYVTAFATPNLAIEPQLGILVVSGGGDTDWLASVGGQVAYHTRGGAISSPYIGGNAAWIRDPGEDSNYALGGVIGYRAILPPGLAVRVEAGYRRWFTGGDFDPVDLNQFSLSFGIGGLVGG